MPVIPQQETIVQYIANSAQTQYTFAFYAPLPTDIQVYYQASNAPPIPASDILTLNSQYTVTYNSDPTTGGYITLLFTPTTGYYLTINRQVMASLTTNFSNAQNFNGANLDAALDRLLLLCQQNQNYALERNLSYVINTYLPNAIPYTQLPPLPQNYFWVGSASGVVAAQIATIPSASVLQSMLANNSPGTDGARIVGYYDTTNNVPTTVDAFLTSLALQHPAQAADTSVTTNAIQIALASNYTLSARNMIIVNVALSNTGATTIAINGGTAIPINKYNNKGRYAALVGTELTGGGIYIFSYDATANVWVVINPNTIATNYFYGASVYLAGAQSCPVGINIVHFDTVDYDPFSIFVSGTYSFVPQRPGYYTITGIIQVAPTAFAGGAALDLYKNGSLWVPLDEKAITTNMTLGSSFTLYMNGTTDFLQLVFVNNTGATASLVSSGFFNNFQITYQGA
jgi:hypothetical protein